MAYNFWPDVVFRVIHFYNGQKKHLRYTIYLVYILHMKQINLYKAGGTINMITALIFIIWWVCMGVFLPVGEAQENFNKLIEHPNWLMVNIIGLVAVILWIFSYLSLLVYDLKINSIVLLALFFGLTGIAFFVAIQYYETFVWPVVVQFNPDLLKIDGPLVFGDRIILIPLVLSGVFVSIGYCFLTWHFLSNLAFSKIAVCLHLAGLLAFANGIIFPVRTLGLILLCSTMFHFGRLIYKKQQLQ